MPSQAVQSTRSAVGRGSDAPVIMDKAFDRLHGTVLGIIGAPLPRCLHLIVLGRLSWCTSRHPVRYRPGRCPPALPALPCPLSTSVWIFAQSCTLLRSCLPRSSNLKTLQRQDSQYSTQCSLSCVACVHATGGAGRGSCPFLFPCSSLPPAVLQALFHALTLVALARR